MPNLDTMPPMQNNIRFFRESADLSQQELGALVGAEKGTISKLERGEMQLTHRWIARISAALKLSPQDLISELPEKKEEKLSSRPTSDAGKKFDRSLWVNTSKRVEEWLLGMDPKEESKISPKIISRIMLSAYFEALERKIKNRDTYVSDGFLNNIKNSADRDDPNDRPR